MAMHVDEFVSTERKVFLVHITVELAKALLEKYNFDNRKLKPSAVSFISRMMERGIWGVSDSMLCITKSGRMFNGQHRLRAAIKTGKGFDCPVMIGCDEEDAYHSDRHVPKSMGDVTRTTERFAAIGVLALTVATGRCKFDGTEVRAMQDRLFSAYNDVMTHCSTIRPKFSSAPCLLAVVVQYMAAKEENRPTILAGYKALILAEETKPASISKLVDWTTDKYRHGHGQARFEMLAQALTAFNEKNILLQHKPKKSLSVGQAKLRVTEVVREANPAKKASSAIRRKPAPPADAAAPLPV